MATEDDLYRALRRGGISSGPELQQSLGISAATLSRWIRSAAGEVVRIGRTRGARYGLHDEIEAIGAEWPVWEIDAEGQVHRRGELHWLHGPAAFWEKTPGRGPLYEGLPPFIADMAPQGYLGRFFPVHYPELQLPPRLTDWSEHHVLKAITQRGEDLVGNLVVGEPAMDRLLQSRPEIIAREDYPAVSRDQVRLGTGSSAAGEFPKFGAYDGEQHLLVKFTAGDDSRADRRWRDLLLSEHIAAETLRASGIEAAGTCPIEVGSQLFLEIRRFDRRGERGRCGTMTLAAVDDTWFGRRDDWPAAAKRMQRAGLLEAGDVEKMLLLEAFGQMIHNNDRHFGNLSFFWQPGDETLALELAPAYDMLPMALAPAANGMLPASSLEPPAPVSALLPVWEHAKEMAREFWRRVAADASISGEFRDLVKKLG